jgi:sulfite reductase (NADPH) flavoprotein alpha-component
VTGAPPSLARLLPDDAPFTPAQRVWLSGFFAALIGGRQPPAAGPRVAVAVLFATQTGTAERLAKKLAKAANARGYDANARELGKLSVDDLAKMEHALLIASTHGDGEPPDAARAFAASLAGATGTPLAKMRFSVLALGDRNYATFCKFGVDLDERLVALGGQRLAPRVDCDVDPAKPFDAWQKALFAQLPPTGTGGATHAAALPAASAAAGDPENEERWNRDRPFPARIVTNRRLGSARDSSATGIDKETRHVALSLAGSKLHYEPGDALGVMPAFPARMVESVLRATGLDAAKLACLPNGELTTLGDALARRCHIGKLAQSTLIKFAAKAQSPELSRLLEPAQHGELERFLWGRELIDLLLAFPGVIRTTGELLEILPPLAPRLYSISSSPRAHPREVHLTVAVVRFDSRGTRRGGLASTFLADRVGDDGAAPVYVHANARFRLPSDPATPILMIGPGTGIAPFRAFLEDDRAQGRRRRSWLFFGARHAAGDFLYRDELHAMQKDGTLTRLDTAFSRDGAEKVYVQHRMREHGAELWRWVQDGASIYVCGDATQMARDVDAALREVLERHGKMSAAQAQLELGSMAANGRYLRDVY